MRNTLTIPCVAAALLLANGCGGTAEAQWGTLKGQVLLEGDLPKISPLVLKGNTETKDAAVCAAEEVPNEELVVDPATKGIANIVIYLAKKPAKVYPESAKSAQKEVTFDQKGCRFLPHVMVVRTDQQVRVLSGDAISHNTHSYPVKNDGENFVVPANDRKGILMKPLKLVEKTPTKVTCDIHPWMSAYWVVVDHPYAAVTDDKGNYEIPNLPVGQHEFIVWQERCGFLDKKYTVTIKAGDNEQKPMKFAASQILK